VTYNGFGAALEHAWQGSFGPGGEGGMNICAQGRLARALRFDPFQFSDVGGDATDRIWFLCAVSQQKFNYDIMTVTLRRWDGYFELDGRARFDHLPIVRTHRFRDNARKNVIVGLPANLITLNLKSAFIFAVNQNVAKFEILHGYDGSAVIQNILQSLFTRAKRLFYPLVFADLSR
jgi:hypothetical protein